MDVKRSIYSHLFYFLLAMWAALVTTMCKCLQDDARQQQIRILTDICDDFCDNLCQIYLASSHASVPLSVYITY